ncbi:non-ribosomal peptide synthetase [Mucilaginibacter lacusdianchii]|uniref:non-ribosomal peptide synthetase n=1 Tax=Mucilaginibacter lacusdianchii TaxID=2684211 RepID=UPI00131CABE8|nr:amino acid adenylation domain-containing protein [Mucilaginibacter sp. JXJ CY 39]
MAGEINRIHISSYSSNFLNDTPVSEQYSHAKSLIGGKQKDMFGIKTLPEIIADISQIVPDKIAVEFKDQKLNYRDLNQKIENIASFLNANGVSDGDIVGLAVDRSAELIVLLLGILKSGAAYLPLDPTFPDERLLFMLQDSSAKVIVTNGRYKGRFQPHVKELITEEFDHAHFTSAMPSVQVHGNHLAYVLYTSGSTGKPKGVMISHANLVNLLVSMIDFPGLGASDRLLAITTISFDIAGLELFLPLIVGATVVIGDTSTIRDGKALLQLIKQEQISVMQATPATWKLMLASGWQEKLPLKILCGGEPMSKDLAEKLLERCSSLWNMYGPTETTVYSTGKQITKHDTEITIGVPVNNTLVYLLDEAGLPVSIGERGELYISGDGVAMGYLNRPELTAEKFLPDPFKKRNATMYRTGDLGQLTPNGEVLCLGRIDQQIKIRGYRIEPGEIEYLLKQHPEVKEAVVTARLEKGEEYRLITYIVPASNAHLNNFKALVPLLKSELKKVLPGYMVPSEFYPVVELPLTLSGKIDYKALPAAKYIMHEEENGASNCCNDTEKLLYEIWADALESRDFNVNDNFFDIGGHSLIAVYVMSEIEIQTGKGLPISAFYEYPTIKELAALLNTDTRERLWKSLVAIRATGNRTPLYLIHGDGLNVLTFSHLASLLDDEQPVYGLQAIGLNNPKIEIGTMEQIAARYVSEIVQQNPKGPYAIAGYSYGGNIGLEMARLLTEMGREVTVLAMIDANAQNSERHRALIPKLVAKVLRQVPKLEWFVKSLLQHPKKTIGYQYLVLQRRLHAVSGKLGLRKKEELEGMFKQFEVIQMKYEWAYENYQLKPYDGEIFLFKANERVYFVEDPDSLGWSAYATNGVGVFDIPGDHKTMLQPPNVKVLAEALQKLLNRQ